MCPQFAVCLELILYRFEPCADANFNIDRSFEVDQSSPLLYNQVLGLAKSARLQ